MCLISVIMSCLEYFDLGASPIGGGMVPAAVAAVFVLGRAVLWFVASAAAFDTDRSGAGASFPAVPYATAMATY